MNNTSQTKQYSQQSQIIDSKGREWRTHKDKIEQLADLMNEQSIHPLETSDELFYIFDAVMTPEEIDFMLKMGGGNQTIENIHQKVDLPKKEAKQILENLIYKGMITIIKDKEGEDVYHLMSIFPGWFELYLMRGEKTEESKLFAERVEAYFRAAYEFGNEEVINQLLRDIGPHIKVLSTKPPKTKKISVGKKVERHENRVFATKSVINILEELDENETITVGHCFCRFEKLLVEDPCRAGLPLETCLSIGPAAEHLMQQGIARKITKEEAIKSVKEWQDKGCIHQATLTMPLKDFHSKYPIDIICNCCWDCCGLIGNYNRGYLPYILTSYHRAVILNPEKCTGCRTCVDYCPVQAIALNDIEKAVINEKLCIGCGQCYHHCPSNAIELIEDEREVFLPMLGKEQARIKPEDYDETEEDDLVDYLTPSTRSEVLEVLEETRQKFLNEEINKAFRKWNKTMLYYFTDLDEYWYFEIKNGKPQPLKEGKVENPDIFYTLSGRVFIGLMRGEIDGFKAFRKKLVKVKAPIRVLIKLQKLIG
ncbi:MAG: 4Fe-4S dicluster domain-containing protein [Candidatus Heimdallarchaeota archaeon]|nr:4Fe-4S dicluster domain-containing protein [Candidatus Heimdallarchaeota archaeon]